MIDPTTNPPEFPCGSGDMRDPTGMTLLDYFAAQALTVWIQAHIDQTVDDLTKEGIAEECYSYAFFMLEERKNYITQ